ncbi:hypothetical protein LXL04_008948 [Taraxacum kok-saghyz]
MKCLEGGTRTKNSGRGVSLSTKGSHKMAGDQVDKAGEGGRQRPLLIVGLLMRVGPEDPGKPNQQISPPPSFRYVYDRDRTHSFPGNPTTAGKTWGYITPARRFELWTSH